MIVFSEHISPRLSYTLNHILKKQLGIEFSLTNDFEEFCSTNVPKINYSKRSATSGIQVIPEGLLFETGIRNNKPVITESENFPCIFNQKEGKLFFDIFSAVFWFLSRYEEYQDYTPDIYNRFPASESFAFKNQLLTRPIVDEWIQYFGRILEDEFHGIEIKKSNFKPITTIDVDSPWCYKNKGFLRNSGGLIRDIFKGKISDVFLRAKVLLNIIPDPGYNFEWIIDLAEKSKTELLFFIHVGDYGRFDKTVNYKSKAFKNFVKNIASKSNIGLHPSYKAAQNRIVFQNEILRLSKIANINIHKSRQHFLVFTIPQYYPQLIELGITDDYTMGFADKAGFRAGTSNPFYFFDLRLNKETKLLVHPFALMDRTLNSYETQTVEESIVIVKTIIENVKKVDGTFVSLWHNESLSNTHEWKGWCHGFYEISTYLSAKQ